MKSLSFECPTCGHDVAEEVVCGVTTSYAFNSVNEDGELEYNGDSETTGGEFSRYQCAGCGFVLDGVSNSEELVEWLKKNDK